MAPKRAREWGAPSPINTYAALFKQDMSKLREMSENLIPGFDSNGKSRIPLVIAICKQRGIAIPKNAPRRSPSSIPPPDPSPEPLSVRRKKQASTRATRSKQTAVPVVPAPQEEDSSQPLEYPLSRNNPLDTRRPAQLGEDEFNYAMRGTPSPPPSFSGPVSPVIGLNFISPRNTPPPEATDQTRAPPADEQSLRQTVEMLAAFRRVNDSLQDQVKGIVNKSQSVKKEASDLRADILAERANTQRMKRFLIHFIQEQPTHYLEQVFPQEDTLFNVTVAENGRPEASELDAMARDDIMKYGTQANKDQLVAMMDEDSDFTDFIDKGKGRAVEGTDSDEVDVENELMYPEPEPVNERSPSDGVPMEHAAGIANFSPPVTYGGTQRIVSMLRNHPMMENVQAKMSATQSPTKDPRLRLQVRSQQLVVAGPKTPPARPARPSALGLPGPSPTKDPRLVLRNGSQLPVVAEQSQSYIRPSAIGLPGPSPRGSTNVAPPNDALPGASSKSHSIVASIPTTMVKNPNRKLEDHDPFVEASVTETMEQKFPAAPLSPTNGDTGQTQLPAREYRFSDFVEFREAVSLSKEATKAQASVLSRISGVQDMAEQNQMIPASSEPRPMSPPLPTRTHTARTQTPNVDNATTLSRPRGPSIYERPSPRPIVRTNTLPDI